MGQAFRIVLATMLLVGLSYGQSLGDIARENRQKHQAKDAPTAKKVITNEDLPERDTPAPLGKGKKKAGDLSPSNAPSDYDEGAAPGSAAEWKSRIRDQKDAIVDLETEIKELKDSIHFVEANAYYNGPQYNQEQARKLQQVAEMEQQLEEQKKNLGETQEAARKAGMGSAVYDP